MFLWLKKFKEDWRLVKTCDSSATYDQKNGKVYFHLFESNKGNRRVEITSTFNNIKPTVLQKHAECSSLYQERIYRWQQGRLDPDIPRYNQVFEEDTINFLKGTV